MSVPATESPPLGTGGSSVGWGENLRRRVADQPIYALIVILVVLFLSLDVVSPGYLSLHSVSSTLTLAAILGVIAGGQTLVLLTAGVDLSVAATASAASYVMALQSGQHGTFEGVVAGLGFGLLVGVVNGIGVGIFRVQPLIMTLGVSGIVAGWLTIYVVNGGSATVPNGVQELGAGTWLTYVPIGLVIVWIPLSIILTLGLRYSGLGRSIIAVGDNPIACRLAGVRIWQVLLVTYSISGVLAALGGIMLAGNNGAVDQNLASSFLLTSVAAAVIGGTSVFGGVGGYAGTILGALILRILESLLTVLNAAESTRYIVYGAIILALTWAYTRVAGTQ
jgi:ribose transport system permease protein